MSECDFLSNGFLFVSTPEGIYIHGEQNETSNHFVWFSPEEVKQDKVFYIAPELTLIFALMAICHTMYI